MEQELLREHQRKYLWPAPHKVPIVAELVVLYVFSAKRRNFDCLCYVETYMQDFCINGMVLLVDITLSALHDITNTNLMHTAPVLPARCHLAAGLLVAPPAKPGLNDILLGNSTRRT